MRRVWIVLTGIAILLTLSAAAQDGQGVTVSQDGSSVSVQVGGQQVSISTDTTVSEAREIAAQHGVDLGGVSDEQLRTSLERLSKLTPEERQELFERVREELQNPGGPREFHVVEGPGVPPSTVLPYGNFSSIENLGLDEPEPSLFKVARRRAAQLVSIRDTRIDAYSDHGLGNGFLVEPSVVVTSRHVAEAVAKEPARYSLERPADLGPSWPNRLTYVRAEFPHQGEDAGDPDLAVIRVEPVSLMNFLRVQLGEAPDPGSGFLVSLGTAETEELPKAATGIATTSIKRRGLGDVKPVLQRTVFGSSVRVYPGLSGAPVFDERGALVGVVTAGWKDYAKTGEAKVVSSESEWEQFGWWTWITPVLTYQEWIVATYGNRGEGS